MTDEPRQCKGCGADLIANRWFVAPGFGPVCERCSRDIETNRQRMVNGGILSDEQLIAECVRRGWRVVQPGSEADRHLFDPPDPDVKTAREQAVLDALEKLFDVVEAMRKAKS